MCWNGYPERPEEEREAAEPWETEGDLPFLPEVPPGQWMPHDWRTHPMGPEEQMYRELLDEDDEDGA